MEDSIHKYIDLIQSFVNGALGGDAFEQRFLEMFKSEDALPEPVFEVLDSLFVDVDAYCGNPDFRDAADLSEEQLRRKATEALEQLHTLRSCFEKGQGNDGS